MRQVQARENPDIVALPDYEVYAVRYATVDRARGENFLISPDDHDSNMPLDYYVWIVRGSHKTWLIDTGFNAAMALRRHRRFLRCPIESLRQLGIEASDISDVIITHLHYDHAGNLDKLPHARIHIQEREVRFATGCEMCRPLFRLPYAVDDVVQLVRRVYADKVHFYQGDAHVAPGIELAWIGGHTDGLQAVRVHTARGWLVIASDAAHFYENLQKESPYPLVYHVGDMLRGWDRLRQLAESDQHIIPGHDPQVMQNYPTVANGDAEIAALHLAPLSI